MKRTPGVKAGLSRDLVLDAALELAGREGMPALTMRRLGAELGVEAMTLYHYVPNKTALIDGVIERLFLKADLTGGGDWRGQLREFAGKLREILLAYPGVLPAVIRPAATAATFDAVETALTTLVAAGFPPGRALDSLNALIVFVIGHTTAEAAIGPDAPPGEIDPARHPLLIKAASEDSDDQSRFGYAVNALLDGYAHHLESAPGKAR